MINIYVGLPGSGKTTKLASIALYLFRRNERYYKKTGVRRLVYSNVKFSDWVEKRYGSFIHYWTELHELWTARDIDVIWQEMAAYLDSQDFEKVPRDLKRWLQLHRHYGVDIYGDTQDFPMIDIAVRRITNNLYKVHKIIGSRDRSATRPKIRFIWGIHILLDVDSSTFADDKQDYKYTGWSFMWNDSFLCSVFNSYEDLDYKAYPPLKHVERTCPHCGVKKLMHN